MHFVGTKFTVLQLGETSGTSLNPEFKLIVTRKVNTFVLYQLLVTPSATCDNLRTREHNKELTLRNKEVLWLSLTQLWKMALCTYECNKEPIH